MSKRFAPAPRAALMVFGNLVGSTAISVASHYCLIMKTWKTFLLWFLETIPSITRGQAGIPWTGGARQHSQPLEPELSKRVYTHLKAPASKLKPGTFILWYNNLSTVMVKRLGSSRNFVLVTLCRSRIYWSLKLLGIDSWSKSWLLPVCQLTL